MYLLKNIRLYKLACVLLTLSLAFVADARVTHIYVSAPEVLDYESFGQTGPYLKITGAFRGEIDPADRRHVDIVDIDLAPLTDGKVWYRSTFFILKPADLSRANGKIFYDFGNRGAKRAIQWFNDGAASNDPVDEEHFGHGYLMREGYTIVLSGYSGHVRDGRNILGAGVPVAVNPDGSPVTGPVVTEHVAEGEADSIISLPYAAARVNDTNGSLTVREHGNGIGESIEGWHYVNDKTVKFPGPASPGWIYEFVYEAKDPLIMGMGHAITRDFLSFLKYEMEDDAGHANPVMMPGDLQAIYSWGRSNGGRNQRDFLRWGFNEDEEGRMVIDGMLPYGTGSGGHVWMNSRFSQPMASSRKHERHYAPEHEFPHTFPVLSDPLSGRTDGILRRCLQTDTCPKVFNIDGANEYWNKASSLNHTNAYGEDLDIDALAPNVRIYAIASTEHNTTFDQVVPEVIGACQQMTNPLYNGPIFRALLAAMDRWVSDGTPPPPSVVPRNSDGTLVPPEAVEYPEIPALDYDGWPALPVFVYTPETMFRYGPLDVSTVPYRRLSGPEYAVQVPQVDEDGNEIAGIRLPGLAVPLGTHLGWSVLKPGAGFPDTCGQHGTFIPFARTRAERMAVGDPRLSLAERYGDEQTFAERIEVAAGHLVDQGFLLEEDKDRIVRRARMYGYNYWRSPLPR